eukprot:gnl/MRDRNA2_/MRDRNA2_72648_c0_seq2.p1 gnl/MRDRNA2_/MRDRNA2_72648_c0~~gnl/MRDRNA2_/MRDRNA2_72648_c0_seq2.p1  ORF type:complete len:208 (+),score=22.73 gnl/MRDRNA2_/MRDRNA2_72648_c0_seq2:187-810(+)
MPIVLLFVFVWTACAEGRQRAPVTSNHDRFLPFSSWKCFLPAFISAATAGFLGGVYATPGPPNMVFVLVMGIQKDEWIGTSACYNVVVVLVRSALLLAWPAGRAEAFRLLPVIVVTCVSGVFGMVVGDKLSNKVSQPRFRQCLFVFLLIGGTTMVYTGCGRATPWLVLLTLILGIPLLAKLSPRPSQIEQRQHLNEEAAEREMDTQG